MKIQFRWRFSPLFYCFLTLPSSLSRLISWLHGCNEWLVLLVFFALPLSLSVCLSLSLYSLPLCCDCFNCLKVQHSLLWANCRLLLLCRLICCWISLVSPPLSLSVSLSLSLSLYVYVCVCRSLSLSLCLSVSLSFSWTCCQEPNGVIPSVVGCLSLFLLLSLFLCQLAVCSSIISLKGRGCVCSHSPSHSFIHYNLKYIWCLHLLWS